MASRLASELAPDLNRTPDELGRMLMSNRLMHNYSGLVSVPDMVCKLVALECP